MVLLLPLRSLASRHLRHAPRLCLLWLWPAACLSPRPRLAPSRHACSPLASLLALAQQPASSHALVRLACSLAHARHRLHAAARALPAC